MEYEGKYHHHFEWNQIYSQMTRDTLCDINVVHMFSDVHEVINLRYSKKSFDFLSQDIETSWTIIS